MTKTVQGSAIFLDLSFPVDHNDFDFEDARIIVIKEDPKILPLESIKEHYKQSIAPVQFQRPESWSPKEKKGFWGSLLMNRIEGVIVVVDIEAALHRIKQIEPLDRSVELYQHLLNKGYEYIVLDGNNRLRFLLALLNDEWGIPEGNYEYIRDLQDGSTTAFRVTRKRNKFSDLPKTVQNVLKKRCCIISKYTQIGYAGLSSVFTATNSGVFPNPQELRNASNSLWSDYVRHLDNKLTVSGLLNLIFADPTRRYCGQDWITECLDFALNAVEEQFNVDDNELVLNCQGITQGSKNTLYKSTFLSKSEQSNYISVFNDISQYVQQMIQDNILDKVALTRKSTVQNLFWMVCNGVNTYEQACDAVRLHEIEYLRKDRFFTDVYEFGEGEEVFGDDLTFKNSCEGSRKMNIEHRYLILSEIIRKVNVEVNEPIAKVLAVK